MSDPSNLPSQSEPGRSVVLALPAGSQFPMILRRRNRLKIRGLPVPVPETNCVRGRGRGRGRNSRGGRDCDRDNHHGDPNMLGGQENPSIQHGELQIQPVSTNNMVNIEVINIESDSEIDEAVAAPNAEEDDLAIFDDLELEDLPIWTNFNQAYGEWPKW